MKRNSLLKRIVSLILILSLVSPLIRVRAENSADNTIYISNKYDLIQLAEDCSFDLWSQGKTVILSNDIDLGNQEFRPIPIFNGTFDGQNHLIKGLYISAEGSNLGFFRYLGEEGKIKNLKVQGQLEPKGDKNTIGGLVGNNSGLIENSSFLGMVNGKERIGGLVGWNNASGRIVNSTSNGLIYGDDLIGGIAGYNGGTIIRGRNHSSVNTTVVEHKLDLEDFTIENINPMKVFLDATDIGGIAGLNTGIIQSSSNHGTIGYPHVGYNVGGIAGRQSGLIQECTNYGQIYGRKEVAGIVGQMEPHINRSIEASRLDDLQRELDKLQVNINSLIGSGKGTMGGISDDLLQMEEGIRESKKYAQIMIDQIEEMLNKDIEEINKISVIGVETLEHLYEILDVLKDSMEILWQVEEPMKAALDYLAKAMKEMSAMSSQMQVFVAQLEYAMSRINLVRVELTKAFEVVQELIDFILDNLDDLNDGSGSGGFGDIDFSDIAKAIEEILDLLDSYFDTDKLYEMFKKIEQIFEHITDAFEHLEDASGVTSSLLYSLQRALGSMEGTSYFTEQAILQLKEALDVLSPLEEKTDELMDKFKDLVDYLKNNLDLEFQTTDDEFMENKESLYSSLDGILDSFQNMATNLDQIGVSILEDFQEVSDQLFVVFAVLINIIEDLTEGEIKSENFIQDVSREEIEQTTEGKVTLCENYGVIEGDINVGGIAGAMAVELGIDPEDELDISTVSTRTVFKRRAILSSSKNFGTIIGKKNNIGGIVGNMDLGYLYDCQSLSNVESQDGSYVGGIAGTSKSAIVNSYARGKLSGKNYIGGISGLAKEIVSSATMVEIVEARAYYGAIAGQVEAGSQIANNFFLANGLHGIDSISYGSKAEPMVYEDLIALEGMPDSFKKFNLRFTVEDALIKKVEFNYGDLSKDIDYPDIPLKPGCYSYWEEVQEEVLTFDREILGYYVQYQKILESTDFRIGVLAQILVEGDFFETDELIVKEHFETGDLPVKENNEVKIWEVIIPEDGNDQHLVRYLLENKNAKLYMLSQGAWQETDYQRDGKYIKFATEGNKIIFSLIESKLPLVKIIIAGLAIVIALILIVIFILLRRRKVKADLN